MRRLASLAASATAVTAVVAAGLAAAQSAASAATSYSVQTLHFKVVTGPTNSTTCDIVGDLYLPSDAKPTHRVPAILTTNGFGGSKDDQAGMTKFFASRDYAVLSYSGLGFGGSGCKITLDDRDWDGKAASQLVSYLGGAPGIAFTDANHTTAAPRLTAVVHDAKDHNGVAHPYDPRVGMIGGSYGGQIQFAAAGVDARVDTIIPIITWNDLSYSLGPNNTALTSGVSSSTPGAVKLNWGLGFSALGVADGLQGAQGDPNRLYPCPNFADFVCPALVTAGSAGYFQPDAVAALRHASVVTFYKKIRVPVLLMQGESDTLFNLNEAVATYRALKAQGTPVKMVWQHWGHSDSTPAPGELSLTDPNPGTQYETARVVNWFDHYLKNASVGTGPEFAYFRDWISYNGIATPAYATSASYPVGSGRNFYFSGANGLVTSTTAVASGSQSLVTPPAGAPTSLDPMDVVGSYADPMTGNDPDAPGTAASWATPALSAPVDVAGSPTLTFTLDAPSAAQSQAAGPAGQLVLFVKIQDVAPDGTASLINRQIAPIRIPDVTKPVKVVLPGFVHRFAKGHQIRLVVAGGSSDYRGGLTPTPVTIASGKGQVLTLPTVP